MSTTIAAASAACEQYERHCPDHLPYTGYPLIAITIVALLALIVGLILNRRSKP